MVEHTGSAGKAMDVRLEVTYIPNSWSDPCGIHLQFTHYPEASYSETYIEHRCSDADLSDAPDRLEIEAHAFAENSAGKQYRLQLRP